MGERRRKLVIPERRGVGENRFTLETTQQKRRFCLSSSDAQGMSPSSRLKSGAPIQLSGLPDGEENPCLTIGQGTNCHCMTLALSSFPLVVLRGPGFPPPAPIGKLEKRIAPGLNASQPSMGFLVHPALIEDWRGPVQSLQTTGTGVSVPVVPHFSQQARSETRTSSWQRQKELAVGMAQKKTFDLFVILLDLSQERLQLGHQGQHQSRFCAGEHFRSQQARLLEVVDQFFRLLSGHRIPRALQQGRQILDRGDVWLSRFEELFFAQSSGRKKSHSE